LYLLYLSPEQQALVIKIQDLRDFNYNIPQGLIQYLLIGPNEAVNDFLVLKAEGNEHPQAVILAHILILDLLLKVLVNSLHQGLSVLAYGTSRNHLLVVLMLDLRRILYGHQLLSLRRLCLVPLPPAALGPRAISRIGLGPMNLVWVICEYCFQVILEQDEERCHD
jgi:hypothetical protein